MRGVMRFGGREVLIGVLVAAAFVALPTGLPLSEVLARWVPGVDGHGVALPVAVTAAVWVCLSAWLLDGARAQLARAERFEAETTVAPALMRSIAVVRRPAGERRQAPAVGRALSPAA